MGSDLKELFSLIDWTHEYTDKKKNPNKLCLLSLSGEQIYIIHPTDHKPNLTIVATSGDNLLVVGESETKTKAHT